MRLYNLHKTSASTVHGSSGGIQHFNQRNPVPCTKPTTSWRLKQNSAASNLASLRSNTTKPNNETRTAASVMMKNPRRRSPKRVQKLHAIWPPPAKTTMLVEGADVVPVQTSSTVSTSSETPLNPVPKPSSALNPTARQESKKVLDPAWEGEEKKHDDFEGSRDKIQEGEEPRPVKTLQKKFSSAFQSPLRLAKIQFRSSPGHRLLQRFQGGGKKEHQPEVSATALLEENEDHSRYSSVRRMPETPVECDPAHSSNEDARDDQVTPGLQDRISLRTFQSPLKKFQLSHKQVRQLQHPFHSPQLSKNETNTTATSETMDALNGRVSSESFHFDLELVKSTDEAAVENLGHELEPPEFGHDHGNLFGDHASVVSKSSSSTLTSNWFDEHQMNTGRIENKSVLDNAVVGNPAPSFGTTTVRDRPMAPTPWASAVHGFVMRPEEDFVRPPVADPRLPAPIDVERRRVSEVRPQTSALEPSFSGDTWSDGDSWIDFTADPFKTTKPDLVARPSATKPFTGHLAPSKIRSSGFVSEAPRSKDMFQGSFQENGSRVEWNAQSREDVSGSVAPQLKSQPPFDWNNEFRKNTQAPKPLQRKTQTQRKIGSDSSSSGNNKPSIEKPGGHEAAESKRHAPLLLGPLLQSRYQMVHQQQSKPILSEITPTKPKVAVKNTLSTPVSALTTDMESPLPEKYTKMLKMGLPEGAVLNAMIRDGIDPGALDKSSSPPIKSRPSSSPGATKPEVDPYRRFRVHWEPHDNVRSNTVWAMVQRENRWTSGNMQLDLEEYNRLFQEAKDPLLKRHVKKEGKLGATVIDAKRANNGGIVLARIKLSHHDIAKAIDGFDYDALTADQIRALLPLLPTAEEEEKLRNNISKAGGKHMLKSECEKFMAAMLGVRQAKQKLDAMLFMKQFTVVIDGLKNDSRLVQKSCEELMSSTRLRALLGLLLELGNRLNTAGQSPKPRASAIRLQSLSRLSQGKAFDRKTTFLEYVARILHRNSPDSVQLRDELPSLRRAQKVDMEQMKEDVASMDARITDIRQMALRIGGNASSTEVEVELMQSSPIGRFALDACLKMASVYREMEELKQSYSTLLNFFGEEQQDEIQAPDVFRILSAFCDQWETSVEQSIAQDRAARRRMNRNHNGHRVSHNQFSPRRPSTEPRSGIGSVLNSIRCKSLNATALDV